MIKWSNKDSFLCKIKIQQKPTKCVCIDVEKIYFKVAHQNY